MKQTDKPREVRIEGRKQKFLKPADPARLVDLLRAFTVLPTLEDWVNGGRRFTTEYTAPGRKTRLKTLGHGLVGIVYASNTDLLVTRTLQILEPNESSKEGIRPMLNIVARSKPADAHSRDFDSGRTHYDLFHDHSGDPLTLYYRVARQGHYELFAYMSEVFMNKEPPIVKIFPDEDPEQVLLDVLSRLDKPPEVSEADERWMVPAVPNQMYTPGKTRPLEQVTFWT